MAAARCPTALYVAGERMPIRSSVTISMRGPTEQTQGFDRRRIGRTLKDALTERQLIHAFIARIHVEIGCGADQPGGVDRTVDAAGKWRLGGSRQVGVNVKGGRPEAATSRSQRRTGAVGANAQQERGEVTDRTRERMIARPPLVVTAQTAGGEGSKSLNSR